MANSHKVNILLKAVDKASGVFQKIADKGERKLGKVEDASEETSKKLEQIGRKGALAADKLEDSLESAANTGNKTAKKLESATDDVSDSLKKAGDKGQKAVQKIEDAADSATKAFDKTSDKLDNKFSRLGTKMQGIGKKMKGVGESMLMGVTAPVVAGFTAVTAGTRNFRNEMSVLKTNVEEAGASMNNIDRAMAKTKAIVGETSAGVEGLSNLLATGFKGQELQKVLNNLIGASAKFKETIKFEEVSNALQETFARGEAVGQFGELLERTGTNLDNFKKRLQEAKRQGQGHNYILQTLANTGLSQVYEQYKKNNKVIINNAEATYRFQRELSKLGETLDPILTKLIKLLTTLTKIFNILPNPIKDLIITIGSLVTAIGPILFGFGTLIDTIGKLSTFISGEGGLATAIATLSNWFSTLASGVSTLIGYLNPWIVLITAIIALILIFKDELATVAKVIGKFLIKKVEEVIDILKELPAAIDKVMKVIKKMPDLIKTVMTKVNAWFKSGSKLVKQLLKDLGDTLANMFNYIIDLGKNSWGRLEDIIIGIAKSIKQKFIQIIQRIKSFFEKIIGFVSSISSRLYDAGVNMITGLYEGIKKKFTDVIDLVESKVSYVVDKVKGILDINSPSKVMMKIGESVSEGLAKGINRSEPQVASAGANIANSSINAFKNSNLKERKGNLKSSGGEQIKIEQHNTFNSPRPLDEKETRRQNERMMKKLGLEMNLR